ncbi:hypothetical protein [Cellulomonas bogoriensis]|uniref:DUF8129 domain-containing protein n=1 Tax=Cellulomonas bogoriensis 69B4 = DSM 16987 TaxID=1386082 RepID=A0A0A0C0D9_9CELL|nr:hypothetical protein [Cellulomonas bogoriensis]KGM13407.1 hypothetical protein N869_14360 [Cellulomonas bogoriensis 69B4 = DSM 16987]
MAEDVPTRDELPLPDYDHLPVTGLAHRIRSLDRSQIDVLTAFERAHGNRTPVLEVLRVRGEELDQGATPSQGDPTGHAPDLAPPPSGSSAVSPATAPAPDIPPTESDAAKPPMRG